MEKRFYLKLQFKPERVVSSKPGEIILEIDPEEYDFRHVEMEVKLNDEPVYTRKSNVITVGDRGGVTLY